MLQRRALAIVFVCLLAGSMGIQAAPLNLPQMPPDIFSGLITINYDATTDRFTADGFPFQYDLPPLYDINPGGFDLDATIDASGTASAGTLTITGDVVGHAGPGTLLTGALDDFGWIPDPAVPPQAPTFEFVYTVTGGMLAPDFGGEGMPIGVILTATSPNFPAGGFEESYSATEAVADTFSLIPEPMSVTLLGAGALALLARRRRSRRTSR
jgi:hypothetical protein